MAATVQRGATRAGPGLTGVVILHGTDTLTRPASGILEALPEPPVPVVLTGAMRPVRDEALRRPPEPHRGALRRPRAAARRLLRAHGRALRLPGVDQGPRARHLRGRRLKPERRPGGAIESALRAVRGFLRPAWGPEPGAGPRSRRRGGGAGRALGRSDPEGRGGLLLRQRRPAAPGVGRDRGDSSRAATGAGERQRLPDLRAPETLARLRGLDRDLAAVPGVASVLSAVSGPPSPAAAFEGPFWSRLLSPGAAKRRTTRPRPC